MNHPRLQRQAITHSRVSPDVIGAVSVISKTTRPPKINWQGVKNLDEFSLPYPTVLLGIGAALWDNVKRDVCPGCNNRRLKPCEICLRCDRWGLDHLLQEKRRRPIIINSYKENRISIHNGIKSKNKNS